MSRRGVFGLVVLAAACARNPATGERQLNLVPKSQEVQLGKQAAAEVATSIGLYDDRGLQEYVAGIGKRMAAISERPQLPWSFQVVDDDAVNAFALPGGYIFVTRGILAHLDNEAQPASVVGHEIGHVTGQHSVNQISKAQLAQLGLGLGMVFSEQARRWGDVLGAGLSVMFLKFGRDDEREADTLGIRYALKTGYDVREMPEVFAALRRVGEAQGQQRLPAWLSTHPTPESRVADTREQIARLDLTSSRMTVDREEYLRRIDGMVFGADPRNGYFQGDRFLHPGLRFQMTLPSGWRKVNLRQAVVAVSPQQDALVQLTLSPAPSPQRGLAAFFQQQGVEQAGAVAIAPGGLPSAASRFLAQTEQGVVGGVVTFVSHAGKTFQLVSYAPAERAAAQLPAFAATHATFAPLTDPKALAAQPARLSIERAPRAMTLGELYRERPAAIPVDQVALLNQMQPDTALQAGQALKWVRGGTATAAPAAATPAGPPPPAEPVTP